MAEPHSPHHANLLIGEASVAFKYLESFWKERGVSLAGSPDFFLFQEELFGIDQARKLAEYANRKAFGERKVFFVAPAKITPEAQNALLKTFEEPIPETYFFLVAREAELILPTLRSRMGAIRLGREAQEENEAADFLKSSLKERLAFAKKFADDERSLSAFLDSLLLKLREKSDPGVIRRVYEVRRYSDDRSVSAKLILEHLSVSL